jgi:hypothetical protein
MSFTLTPKLTLTGTATDFPDAIALSQEKALTVSQPYVGFSRDTAPASGGTLNEIKPSGSANQYLYVKHTGFQADGTTATTNQLGLYVTGLDTDSDTNTIEFARIAANEFAIIPIMSNKIISALSSSSHVIQFEYAYFTAG